MKQGYSVLIPDQIGCGKSSKLSHYQYSFAALAQFTKNLMQSLSIKRSIELGHSMGGILASRFALMFPGMTQTLVLLNPIGLEDYLKYVEYKDYDFFYQMELKKTSSGIKKHQSINYCAGKWNSQYQSLTNFMVGQYQFLGKSAAKMIPNAQLYELNDLGHLPHIEDFQLFCSVATESNQIKEWWD